MKWTHGDRETLEETLGIFSFLLMDAKQRASIRFIQTLWQVIQNATNTGRKTATQSVNLEDDPSKPTSYVGIYCEARDDVHDNSHAVCLAREHIND